MSTARNAKRSAMRNTSAEAKLCAIRRVQEGESKASVARDIGVPESTLRGWCKNVTRISHQSRQSSPDTDESLEPKEKKQKTFSSPTMVQPFNLSLKAPPSSSYYASQSSKALYTPVDYSKTELDSIAKTPQNLSIKTETPKLTASQNTEKEKKKAELAKLSVDFGLNKPEVSAASFTDFTQSMNAVHKWNYVLQNCKQLLGYNGNGFTKKKTNTEHTPMATNSKLVDLTSADDYLSNWVTNISAQAALMVQLSNASNNSDATATSFNSSNISSDVSSPSISRNGISSAYNGLSSPPQSSIPINSSDFNNKQTSTSTFLNWYQNQLNSGSTATSSETKPILYQQLTRESNDVDNLSLNQSSSVARSKSVLDNLLLVNNNNNNTLNDHNLSSSNMTPEEAIEHGDKFMKWLETFTSPTITALQIMQFRSLLTNVKKTINPKNDGVKNETKVSRK